MAQSNEPTGWSLTKHLTSLLQVNDNGWNLSLFEDQNEVNTSLCGNCKEVCCDAVELGCDHDDDDIVLFCNSCLKDLISTNSNKCPINQHLDPIISSVRAVRRQILRASVICPYSIQYKRRNKNANVDNEVVMDTIGCDQKEGAPVAAASDDIGDGCTEWKGTLNELLNGDHLHQCVLKHDATSIQKLQMEEMQKKNQSLQKTIRGLEADKITQQERIDTLQANVKNIELFKEQIRGLEAEKSHQMQTIQELRTNIQAIQTQNATQQQTIQELRSTNVQDTQHIRQQLQAKTRAMKEVEAEKATQQELIQELHANVGNLSSDQRHSVTQLKKSLSISSNDNSQRFVWLRSEDEKKENHLELVKIVSEHPIRIAFVDGKRKDSSNDVLSLAPPVNSIDGICKCNKQILNGLKILMKDVRDEVVETEKVVTKTREKAIRKEEVAKKVGDFVHSSDFDRNGICYALGSHFGTKAWRNPMDQGLITVHSLHGWARGEAKHVVARDVYSYNYTNSKENGCIVICFKNGSIQPTAYTWRHDTMKNYYPRNWNFEGSNDDVTWDILKRHVNDDKHGINDRQASTTWRITNCNKSYKMFRFKITGKNMDSWGGGHYHICCGGFEIYGCLNS